MSNPVEKYLNESGRDMLLIEKDKFLNKEDIEELLSYIENQKEGVYYDFEKKRCDELALKLEYIRGLLK